MYTVKVTNNYFRTLAVDNPNANEVNHLIPSGSTSTFEKWGSHIIYVPGMGAINFIDLGDKKLPGYDDPKIPWTEKTWGGLIRYRCLDAYFRYEGGGEVDAVVDELGSLALHFPQGGMIIDIPDLVVK